MKIKRMRSLRAVTLTELLVVLAIVTLLATLAVPVFISQMQRARVATAQAEVRAIAEAEQAVAIQHGFFVPIHILDNIPDRASGSSVGGSGTDRDDFENQTSIGSHYVIDATRSLEEQVLNGGGTTPQIPLTRTGDGRVARMVQTWQGPFLNPKRVWYVGQTAGIPTSGDLHQDLVLDPWGNPYRFYSDLGYVGTAGPSTVSNETITLGMDDGRQSTQEVDRFDRFAIVSYGPDGVTGFNGDPLEWEDDVFYTFSGVAGNETTYQGF